MPAWRGLRAGTGSEEDLEPDRQKRQTSRLRVALEIPVLVVVAVVIAVVVKTFIAQAFFIPSASMEPQLESGDRVVVSRLAYRLHEPRRGDIVVFDDPEQVADDDGSFIAWRFGRDALEAVGLVRPAEKELIKRVVGLPGETIEGREGVVHIDDRPLFEPYLPESVVMPDFPATTVPEGHVFVMGDNRTNSKDSRIVGPVPVDSIVGRAIARIWPPGRLAYL